MPQKQRNLFEQSINNAHNFIGKLNEEKPTQLTETQSRRKRKQKAIQDAQKKSSFDGKSSFSVENKFNCFFQINGSWRTIINLLC